MDKKVKIYVGLLLLLTLALIAVEYSKPKPINWFSSYVRKHKIPYGTYVLYQQLPTLFPDVKIENVPVSPYVFLQDETKKGTYIFIDNAINFDKEAFKKLLAFAERGNTVFVSTHGANVDTLKLKTAPLLSLKIKEKPYFKIVNPTFKNTKFKFDRAFSNTVFTKIDTLKTTVLGVTGYLDDQDEVTEKGINYIAYKHGKGNIYFHTFPEAFTNYNILKDKNYKHTEAILSYLNPKGTIYWDSFYKTGKSRIASPMHYVLTNKSLKWAYYITLISVLFFIIFEGKRKQRAIKVIKPLKNQTLAFTRTIANMYFEKRENKSIAQHQIDFLLQYIRTELHILTDHINTDFYKQVAEKSGKPLDTVTELFNFIKVIQQQETIIEKDLIKLNKLIEYFKNK